MTGHDLSVLSSRDVQPLDRSQPAIRRSLGAADPAAIAELHKRVYSAEYGRNQAFTDAVATSVQAAVERGWPHRGGAVWLIDDDRTVRLEGSLGLTREADGLGRVRWFVLDHELRGRGLGRQLIDELLAEARAQSINRLELETFSALTAAAHIYRTVGFRLVSSRERDDWGPTITYQHYELEL
jgi:GNAT superfamily N-acetyltransferase